MLIGYARVSTLDQNPALTLRLLNVTSEVLLPSVDESARAVTELYLNRANGA